MVSSALNLTNYSHYFSQKPTEEFENTTSFADKIKAAARQKFTVRAAEADGALNL